MLRIFCVVTIFLFLAVPVVDSAKVLPRFKGKSSVGRGAVSSGLGVSPRFRVDRRALLVTFSNLQKVNNVTYTLIYQTNGKDEGVSGSVDSSGGNVASRELEFGTCSSGDCRYHGNLANMRFEVVSELPNGKKTLRRFRIRI